MTKIEKCSNSQKGRIVIHKDNKEKRIYIEELNDYLQQGWVKGISPTHRLISSQVHKNKKPWNKGTKGIMKSNNGTFKKGQSPWNKGTKNCQVAWNKGLTKNQDDRVKKISKTKQGHVVSKETKEKISKSHKGKHLSKDCLKIKLSKEYLTKKKNNSFNTSKVEEQFYKELSSIYKSKTIYRQYKSKDYPYYCDFYIVEDNLYIEVNAHWTHGGKPYNPTDSECIKQLSEWKEKAKTSQFYKNAIETWTIRDVEKQKWAKEHNLNYKVIY